MLPMTSHGIKSGEGIDEAGGSKTGNFSELLYFEIWSDLVNTAISTRGRILCSLGIAWDDIQIQTSARVG
jgi:hypothetical protein